MKRTVPDAFGYVLLTAAVLAIAGAGSSWAAGLYDGTYHGTLKGVGVNAVSCAKSAPVQMTVTEGKLEYHHFGNTLITATVAADGSFSGSAQNMYKVRSSMQQAQTLNGTIAGGRITAETKVGNSCTYALELKRY